MALRDFSFVKVDGFLLEVLVENHINEGVAEKQKEIRRRRKDKGRAVFYLHFVLSSPLSLFVLLKISGVERGREQVS